MTGGKPRADDVFDVQRIRELVELMQEFELSEVDLQQEEHSIRLRRGPTGVLPPAAPPMLPPQPTAAPQQPADAPAAAAPVEDENTVLIKSPMVGTFYCRPNPDSDPFVKVGDAIGPETVVCIIEAMKVFNEIPADCSGKIVAVLVDNEEPVEFGKPLFKVDTST